MSPFMILALLVGMTLFTSRAFSEEPLSGKRKELFQIHALVKQLKATPGRSKRPVLGVLTHWNARINTYADDRARQLDRPELYPLYYDCCRIMENLYGPNLETFISKDVMGWPSQFTIVKLEDHDWGKSHLVVGLWEGNDSTGFFFRHLQGDFPAREGVQKSDSWNLKGVFIDAKAPPKKQENSAKSKDDQKPSPKTETESEKTVK